MWFSPTRPAISSARTPHAPGCPPLYYSTLPVLCKFCRAHRHFASIPFAMANSSTSAANFGQCLPKTSSRCSTESVTATHDFELADYLLLDGMGVGKYVSSSTFSVGGHDWNIRFYPDGLTEEFKEYVTVSLYCLSPAKEVRTRYTLNIREKEGKVNVASLGLQKDTFSPTNAAWDYPIFVEKSKLKSLSDLHKDQFIIRCVLTVIKESRTGVKRKLITIPQPNLQDGLEHMRKNGEGADVTFSVSGRVFNAHRCVLAAGSPVFKAELLSSIKEKATECIEIDDIEPQIFEALLHFIYTDSLLDGEYHKETETAELQHLLVAADRYGLERLRVMCEAKLCESIGVENAATTLALAEQHHCRDLREICIEFIAPRNMLNVVMETDGFNHLVVSCPHLLKEILGKVYQND